MHPLHPYSLLSYDFKQEAQPCSPFYQHGKLLLRLQQAGQRRMECPDGMLQCKGGEVRVICNHEK